MDLLASDDVLLRLFGTPHGDLLFHRRYGWMRYRAGSWEPIRDQDLPEELRAAYPTFARLGQGGGDAAFVAEHWMGTAAAQAPEAGGG
jgi:hypothetical protein